MQRDQTELQNLVRRLDRVERQNRTLKRAWTVTMLIVVALVLMGQSLPNKVPDVIVARKFALVDAKGNGRALLGFAPDNSPVLLLNRPDGSLGATLEVGGPQGQPVLSLYDKNGKPRSVLGVDTDGSPGLSFSDKDGKPRLGLAVSSERSGGLVLYGNDAKPRASIGLTTSWSPFMILSDDSGKPRVVVGNTEVQTAITGVTNKKADFSANILDKTGKLIWSTP
jgi:hypothetical protein